MGSGCGAGIHAALAVLPHPARGVVFHQSIPSSQVFWVPDLGQSAEVGGDGTSLRLFLLLLFYLLEKPLLLASVQLRSSGGGC